MYILCMRACACIYVCMCVCVCVCVRACTVVACVHSDDWLGFGPKVKNISLVLVCLSLAETEQTRTEHCRGNLFAGPWG